MTKSGIPMLTDFGLSRALDYPWSKALMSSSQDSPRGTTRWMACELVKDVKFCAPCTEASDMWAFGMTIYVRISRSCSTR